MEIGILITPGEENGLQVGDRRKGGLADLPETHRGLVEGPVTAIMSSINRDGSVQLSPVWVLDDGEHLLVNSVRGRQKDRNLRARPQISLCFLNPENAYHWLSVRGEIVDVVVEDDPERGHLATETIDRGAKLYMGVDEYPVRDPRGEVRSLYYVRPDKVIAMGQP